METTEMNSANSGTCQHWIVAKLSQLWAMIAKKKKSIVCYILRRARALVLDELEVLSLLFICCGLGFGFAFLAIDLIFFALEKPDYCRVVLKKSKLPWAIYLSNTLLGYLMIQFIRQFLCNLLGSDCEDYFALLEFIYDVVAVFLGDVVPPKFLKPLLDSLKFSNLYVFELSEQIETEELINGGNNETQIDVVENDADIQDANHTDMQTTQERRHS